MKKAKILFVGGGGSNAWTPNIVKDLMLTESLGNCEVVLYDINKKASDLNKTFLDQLAEKFKLNFKVTSTDKPAVAFKDANYIIIAISTGGLKSMAYDFSIPKEYGIYHTVGHVNYLWNGRMKYAKPLLLNIPQ
jgi:alpha-galactosidase/6-phospho-beta-glucosidase family protein